MPFDVEERIKKQVKNTILLIDPNQDDQKYLIDSFDADYYSFVRSDDVKKGFDKLLEDKEIISLIILDIASNPDDGLDFLAKRKENNDVKNIPIVIVTEHKALEVECLSLGASHFIVKPFESQQLIKARVESILSLHRKNMIISKASEDEVTGLLTAEFFIHYASELLHNENDYDMIAIRLSNYSILSELYPRERCYALLKGMAKALLNIAASNGGFAARSHADSFYLIIPAQNDYNWIIQDIRNIIITDELKELRTKVKLGVYQCVNKKLTVNTLAQIAMNTCISIVDRETESIAFYDEIQHKQELFHQELINDFEDAIKEKQFKVYLQPKYDVRHNRPLLVGAEALVRWDSPRLGFVSPGDFIPFFEKNGLIEDLDRYVFDETVSIMKDLLSIYGKDAPHISINLSRTDFYDPTLLDKMIATLNKYGVPPKYIHIEITESAYTKDAHQLISSINELRKAGFIIEIDDFGSGYSTLNMLSSIPFDVLKIDMIFMKSINHNEGTKHIVKGIVDIAKALGVKTVSEGVENKSQYLFLKGLGIDYIQGYYLSKPLPSDGFKELLLKEAKYHA